MRHLVKSQDGVALPVATAMLLVISFLVVAFFAVSMQANDTSVKDRSAKRALAAAEAGLQTAVYRLNQIRPEIAATSCLTTVAVATGSGGAATGECPGQTAQIGNGASYTYYVTPEGSASGCVQMPGVTSIPAEERCVTSVGTHGGVSRRIQTRIIARPLIPDFNTTGLVGKSLVYAWNSVHLHTDVGSNVHVGLDNSITVEDDSSINVNGRVLLLTGATYDYQNSVVVDGGTQTVTTPFDMPVPDFEAVETTNDNANLTTDLGTMWDSGTRRINFTTGERTISPGTYHVCGVHLSDSVKLKFSHAGNARTRIYVDSPSRPGSFCAGQADPAGTFTADNSVEINVETGQREELLDIYMYGTANNDTRSVYSWCSPHTTPVLEGECRSDFMLDNSVKFYGAVYAPNSTVQAHNSVEITGSVAADKIRFFNSVTFRLTDDMIDKPQEPPSAAERRGWAECRGLASVSTDPESGC